MTFPSPPLNSLVHTQIYLSKEGWASESSKIILSAISTTLSNCFECKIALTGGRSAEILYAELANMLNHNALGSLRLYQTDERYVPFDHPDNNSRMIRNSFLHNCSEISSNIFFSIDTSCNEIAMATRLYNDIFPDQLDILILTIGDDGHIASIFSDYNIKNPNDKIAFVDSDLKNNNYHSRITITPDVILKAKKIFVLAPTEKKRAVMKKILGSQGNINYIYPGSLAIRGTWLLSN